MPRGSFEELRSSVSPELVLRSRKEKILISIKQTGTFHASDIVSVFGIYPLSPTAEIQSRYIAFANKLDRE